MRNLDLPDTLRHKIALFKENGSLFRDQNDLFLESSWLQVMYGQGITPNDYHGLVNTFSDEKLKEMLTRLLKIKREPLSQLPSHDEYLNGMVKRAKQNMSANA
jgi:tryptophan halogenase